MVDSHDLAGKWLVRTVRQSINLSEKLICRSGARYSVAEGEGFALMHGRAATLLREDNPFEAHATLLPTTLVYHREHRHGEGIELHTAFELHASDAQEAVMHCVIAHEVARRLGKSGVCAIDTSLADQLCGVRLPTQAMIDAIGSDPISSYPEEERWPDVIHEVFVEFSKKFDLPYDVFKTSGLKDDGICFVAADTMIHKAQRLMERLNKAGIHTGLIAVSLVSPFARDAVARALQNQNTVIVLGEESIAEQSALLVGVYDACTPNGSESKKHIHYISPNAPRSLERLSAILGVSVSVFTEAPANATTQTHVVGAAPGGDLSFGLLLDLAAYLTREKTQSIHRIPAPHPVVSALAIGDSEPKKDLPLKVDLLFLSHPGLLDIEDIMACVAPNGIVLIQGRSIADASFWPMLSETQKHYVEQANLSLYALPGDLTGEYQTMNRYASFVVHGAMLSLICRAALPTLLEFLATQGILSAPEVEHIRMGAGAVRPVDRSIDLAASHDPYFAPQLQPPKMLPSDPSRVDRAQWRSAIRNFYVRGPQAEFMNHPLPGLSIRPAALNYYLERLDQRRDYPMLATRIHGDPTLETQNLDATLRGIMGDLSGKEEAQNTLDHYLKAAAAAADATLHITPAQQVLSDTLQTIESDENADKATLDHIREWINALPPETHLIGLNKHTLLDLYVLSVRAARRSRMRDVRADIRLLVTQLRDALRIENESAPSEANYRHARASFGDRAEQFLNTDKLAQHLNKQHRAHVSPDAIRRERMARTLTTLETFLSDVSHSDDLILIYASHVEVKSTYDRVRTIRHDDPIAIASGVFDALNQQSIEAFKAMRTARLDIANEFDEDFHSDILEHFTWQDLSEDELRLLPVIGIVETTSHLYARLTELSRLMRSGAPLDVLAIDPTSSAMMTPDSLTPTAYNPGFSYLATAYRDACVAQSSLARPQHLVKTLARMNRVLRPAVSVVSCPTWQWRLPARVQLEGVHLGRVAPLFQYDPTLADSSATSRYTIEDNEQPQRLWPICDVKYTDENDTCHTMTMAFTFAHALALEPGYHQYFRILPNDAWNDELVEISEFLATPETDKPRIPFIWGVVDSTLRKCIMTRDVANACRDRMQRWQTLSELARTGEARAQAAPAAQTTALPAADMAELHDLRDKLAHANALITRLRSACLAMATDMDVIMSDEPVPAPQKEDDPTAIDDPAGIAEVCDESTLIETLNGAGASSQTLSAVSDTPKTPYIDTERCVGCGACVSINDDVFEFDDDGKARIKPDATTDACEDAASSCPMQCIHI